jgi:hypothetical protein
LVPLRLAAGKFTADVVLADLLGGYRSAAAFDATT